MNLDVDSILDVLKALHEHGVEYVLVGGLAVAIHGIPRMTEDIDLFVRREPLNLARLKAALSAVFHDDAIQEITIRDLEDYQVVRYGTPADYYIDIMDRVGEAFVFDDLSYEIIESHGVPIKVATIETLMKLKSGTLRDRDRADVILLAEKLKGRK